MPVFTMTRDDNEIVNVDRLELYIPKELFNAERIDKDIEHAAVATSVGDSFKIIALLNARVAMTPEDKIEDSKIYTLNYPQLVVTSPSSFATETLTLFPGTEPEQYIVLKYNQGDILMPSRAKQDVDNCVKFLNLLTRGKIPRTIKYEDIFKAWKTNLALNGADAGVPDSYLQMIIAALYKDKSDVRKDFRFVYGKDMSRNDYIPNNIRDAVSSSSVFAAQTFEHMSRMIVTSVNMTRRGLEQERNPVEATLWI